MFLGVDGGGTKTAVCLVTQDGRVAGRAQVAGTYSPDGDLVRMAALLAEGIGAVCAEAGTSPGEVDYAFFALPGYGEAARLVPALDAMPRGILGHRRYRCDNDMVAGWAGSLGCADGINVISGTGSMAYGRFGESSARTGGWGELFGDEGSGYWIGVRALAAFSRMSDGRERQTALYAAVRAEFATEWGVDQDLDIVDVVLNRWSRSRTRVADLSRVVAGAAGDGDPRAHSIVSDAADELVLLVDAARAKLGVPDGEPMPVSYSGGVFRARIVRDAFTARLAAADGTYVVRTPLYEPVVGAALYAASLAGSPLDRDARSRLPGVDEDHDA